MNMIIINISGTMVIWSMSVTDGSGYLIPWYIIILVPINFCGNLYSNNTHTLRPDRWYYTIYNKDLIYVDA